MRSALFLAYHYPPLRSAGVERSLKFARYLPEFGYRVKVLSTTAYGAPPEDDGVLRAWEPLALYRRVFNRSARTGDPAIAARTGSGLAARAVRYWRRRLFVPDAQIMWIPFARRRALRWLRDNHADVIYSSSPPASAHLLGLRLKRLTGLPWIADFRDAWTYDPLDPSLMEIKWRLAKEQRMERAVVEGADATVAATQISAEYLVRNYSTAAARIEVIPNGFDRCDLPTPEFPEAPAGGPMVIVHTGSFAYSHPRRSPATIFEALRRLIASDAGWATRVRLVLVGRLTPEERDAAESLVNCGAVELVGPVARPEALARQRGADLLLLVDHARSWPASNVPGKLYEYLAMGRPILALCGAGMVERLMDDLGAGECVPEDDPEAVSRVLEDLHRRWRRGELQFTVDADVLRSHERRSLAERLAQCFDTVLARSSARGEAE